MPWIRAENTLLLLIGEFQNTLNKCVWIERYHTRRQSMVYVQERRPGGCYSICEHGIKLWGSLLDLTPVDLNFRGSLLDLCTGSLRSRRYAGASTVGVCGKTIGAGNQRTWFIPDHAWRCCNFRDRFSSARTNRRLLSQKYIIDEKTTYRIVKQRANSD